MLCNSLIFVGFAKPATCLIVVIGTFLRVLQERRFVTKVLMSVILDPLKYLVSENSKPHHPLVCYC